MDILNQSVMHKGPLSSVEKIDIWYDSRDGWEAVVKHKDSLMESRLYRNYVSLRSLIYAIDKDVKEAK